MKPGKLDLPTIWRGCDWGPVTMRWKNENGSDMNLHGFTPVARSLNIDLRAAVTDESHGVTEIVLTSDQTKNLKLGVESWDWVWLQGPLQTPYRYSPILAGKVEIKSPTTNLNPGTPGP